MSNLFSKKFFAVLALQLVGTLAAPAPTDRCPPRPTKTITVTVTPTVTPSPPGPSTTCNVSICADYINECGIWYGGCFLAPECGGTWPSYTPPACPSTTPTPSTTTLVTPTITGTACTFSICADYIDACGRGYGGCFLAPECGGTWPTFTPPPGCTVTPTPDPTPTLTLGPGPDSSSFPTRCQVTSTICTDRYNPCEPWNIGTCYLNPECGGTAPPPPNTVCSVTTTREVTTTLPGEDYERVKRLVDWVTWTTTIPEVTPTINWEWGL